MSNSVDRKKLRNRKKTKEEQNVKRRVYDALNVLLAAEILRKQNKMVSMFYLESRDKEDPNSQPTSEKTMLKTQIVDFT